MDTKRAGNKFFGKFYHILVKYGSRDNEMMLDLLRSHSILFYEAHLEVNLPNSRQLMRQFESGFHNSIKKSLKISKRFGDYYL